MNAEATHSKFGGRSASSAPAKTGRRKTGAGVYLVALLTSALFLLLMAHFMQQRGEPLATQSKPTETNYAQTDGFFLPGRTDIIN